MSSSGPGMLSIGAWDAKYGLKVFNLFPIRLVLQVMPGGHFDDQCIFPIFCYSTHGVEDESETLSDEWISSDSFLQVMPGGRFNDQCIFPIFCDPAPGVEGESEALSDEWISSGSFLQVMPGGRFDDHRPVYFLRFLRSSAWSRRVRARPFGGVAHRCNGALTAGRPCCCGRFAFQREPLCTAHA